MYMELLQPETRRRLDDLHAREMAKRQDVAWRADFTHPFINKAVIHKLSKWVGFCSDVTDGLATVRGRVFPVGEVDYLWAWSVVPHPVVLDRPLSPLMRRIVAVKRSVDDGMKLVDACAKHDVYIKTWHRKKHELKGMNVADSAYDWTPTVEFSDCEIDAIRALNRCGGRKAAAEYLGISDDLMKKRICYAKKRAGVGTDAQVIAIARKDGLLK